LLAKIIDHFNNIVHFLSSHWNFLKGIIPQIIDDDIVKDFVFL